MERTTLDIPEIIYKYRSWSNPFHKRCLTENELYFAEPAEINDPFDFRIFLDFSFLDNEQKKRDYFTKAFEKIDNAEILAQFKDYETAMEFNINAITEHPEKAQIYFNNFYLNKLNMFRILSFSTICDNILMWSHYADNHQGFCIGFDPNSFKKNQRILMGPVHYSAEYPRISPLDIEEIPAVLARCLTKASEWEYENEFRIIKILSKEDRLTGRKEFSKEHIIKEVILGSDIKQEKALEIATICKKRDIPLFYMEKVPFKFQLRKTRII